MRIALAGLLAVATVFLLAACESEGIGTTTRIFSAPAWTGAETFEYDLVRGGDLYGYCTHETVPGDNGGLTLKTLCTDSGGKGNRDDSTAVVDPQTLEPIESERVVFNADTSVRTTRRAEYDPPEVAISLVAIDTDTEEVKQQFDTTRDLPKQEPGQPPPGWYDEASLFWLMRGIPLEDGFEGRYANINIGTAQINGADVKVDGQEEIEVPAGKFQVWRIRVESSVVNRFWVEVEAPHRVIEARLEDVTFQLTSSQ